MVALTSPHAPLAGRTILVTRAVHQAQSTLDAVVRHGGDALLLPCLEIVHHAEAVNAAVQALSHDTDATVLITSVNGINALIENNTVECVRKMLGGHRQIVAVGSRTAQALQRLGVNRVVVPEPFSQQGVAAWWDMHGWPETLIFVRAAKGCDDLLPQLQAHGCVTAMFACYSSQVPSQAAPEAVVRLLQQGEVDAVLLGSSATARGFITRVGADLAARPIVVAISQRVADEAIKLGLRVQVVATEASFDAMLDQLGDYFGGAR
ncbi:MAG: uroporphyrinogen-III synthase [Mariprofundales bacterium]